MALWRVVGLGILAAGIVLVVLGLQATGTFSEEVTKELTGEYSARTIWFIAGGAAAVAIGGALGLTGRKPGKSHAT
jgi:hypothetical protein